MILVVGDVVQLGLVSNYQRPEMQIRFFKKVMQYIHVEGLLGRRDLRPFDFKGLWKTVPRFHFVNLRSNFMGFVEWAPNCPQNHNGQAVVFQMAAFIAIDVERLTHDVFPTSLVASPSPTA
jgi:hypothetical protein